MNMLANICTSSKENAHHLRELINTMYHFRDIEIKPVVRGYSIAIVFGTFAFAPI